MSTLEERIEEFESKVANGELCWNGNPERPLSHIRLHKFIRETWNLALSEAEGAEQDFLLAKGVHRAERENMLSALRALRSNS